MKPFFVHLFHILFVGSLFLYVGIQRTNIPKFFYPILLALAVVIFLYHGYKTYVKLSSGKTPWVNLIHMFIIIGMAVELVLVAIQHLIVLL